MVRVSSFPPIIGTNPKVLVLGTMPGVASLTRVEYYAHKQNHFWKIFYALFGDGAVAETFEARKRFVESLPIALWDVLASCDRPGSLDSNIRNAVENDIPGLLNDYPTIRSIVFNGQQAQNFFRKKFGNTIEIDQYVMPSTSPAHTIGYEAKRNAWSLLLDLV